LKSLLRTKAIREGKAVFPTGFSHCYLYCSELLIQGHCCVYFGVWLYLSILLYQSLVRLRSERIWMTHFVKMKLCWYCCQRLRREHPLHPCYSSAWGHLLWIEFSKIMVEFIWKRQLVFYLRKYYCPSGTTMFQGAEDDSRNRQGDGQWLSEEDDQITVTPIMKPCLKKSFLIQKTYW
jgi:hypothetical protein